MSTQVLRRIVVVVQVHLDVSPAVVAEFCQLTHVFRRVCPLVRIGRIEERMLRWPTAHVGKFRHHPRVFRHPPLHSFPLDRQSRLAPHRFEVIGDAEEDVQRPRRQRPQGSVGQLSDRARGKSADLKHRQSVEAASAISASRLVRCQVPEGVATSHRQKPTSKAAFTLQKRLVARSNFTVPWFPVSRKPTSATA